MRQQVMHVQGVRGSGRVGRQPRGRRGRAGAALHKHGAGAVQRCEGGARRDALPPEARPRYRHLPHLPAANSSSQQQEAHPLVPCSHQVT